MSNPFGVFKRVFGEGTLYLAFLHFESEDLPKAFILVRESCEATEAAVSDLRGFLIQSGWREHLTVCAAMLADRQLAAILATDLWTAFDAGSWVSPQLAVTALLCDPCFEANARARVECMCLQHTKALDSLPPVERHVITGPGSASERAAKAMTAIVYLLGLSPGNAEWLDNQLARREVRALIEHDVDRGGLIAERWLASVRGRSDELGLQIG